MLFQSILFYIFSAVLIGAAIGVVFSRNPVHAVMFLVLAFFQSAVLWILAEAEFLAIVLVLFGAKRLRNVGSDLGGAIKGFRQSMKEEDTPGGDAEKLEDAGDSRVIDAEVSSKEQKKV